MISEEGSLLSSARFWRMILGGILLILFVFGFWNEIVIVLSLLWSFLRLLFGYPITILINTEIVKAMWLMTLHTALFIAIYLILLAWTSHFVLPAQTSKDQREIFNRLWAYNLPLTYSHGPAVFVEKGEPKAEKGELEEGGQGVALLDLYSAIVLEQQQGNDDGLYEGGEKTVLHRLLKWFSGFLTAIKKTVMIILGVKEEENNDAMVRAAGPGLVLIKNGEKIVGSADLRKQFRKSSNLYCNTGDGIEVSTSVSVTFTLGEPPEILNVARINEGWKIVKLEPFIQIQKDPDATQATGWRIHVLPEELREEDQHEIETFFQQGKFSWARDKAGSTKDKSGDNLPYIFDEARVINALYARARDVKEGKLGEWTELPLDVAVEILRNLLIHTPYDELYKPTEPDEYPMKKFKAKFAQQVKNTGVLGYQIVRRADGHPLEDGQTFKTSGLVFSPPQIFVSPAVLRDRGIKVLNASFSDLEPSKTVREKIFDAWQARWQQEADKIRAEHELQAKRIRSRERAKAQQDMIISISNILQSSQYTSEALVMRLYQALETAATQPATQRLLPRDTIRMLWNLRQWLLPDEHLKDDISPEDYVEGEETKPDD